MAAVNLPTVAVLLGTYNGAAHLREQLQSIEVQCGVHIALYVSDDGSSDSTLDVLQDWSNTATIQSLDVRAGPGQGFARNYLSLAASPNVVGDYFAFCDQDDVWLPEKLRRAISLLTPHGPTEPALYGSRTLAMSESGELLRLSPLFSRPPTFRNALLQNIAGGNTMVFNLAAKQLIQRAGVRRVVCHDWWAYLLVSGAGGRVIFDDYAGVHYRQHESNQIGSNWNWSARFKRFYQVLRGRARCWNDINCSALKSVREELTEENRELLDKLEGLRHSRLSARLHSIRDLGLYLQNPLADAGLYAAAALRKL